MATFIVKTSCEYEIEIAAETPESAIEDAKAVDLEYWTESWTPLTVEGVVAT